MPVYVYQCDECDLQFEAIQRFSDEPLSECIRCQGGVHRVIQPVGVIFKGSGFYVTDNRGKSSTMPPGKRDQEAPTEKSPEADTQPGEGPPPKESTVSEKKAAEPG